MKRIVIFLCLIFSTILSLAQSEESCLPDGITFSTQAEIDNFQTNYPGCTEIDGSVMISGENITNLNGLSILTSIGGDLRIGEATHGSNDSLTNISGLQNLTSIGGRLTISNNKALTSLSGLIGLTSIGGSLGIHGNSLLTNLAGLEGITSIPGGLDVSNNNSLTNLTGLEGVTNISIGLHITYNYALTDLTGLDGLNFISGSLYINHNYALTSLSGLDNLDSIEGDLTITQNDSLSVCDAPFICNYLSDPPGSINIYDNAPGCGGQIELAYQCGITYDCLASGTYHFTTQGDIDYFAFVYPGCTDLTAGVSIEGNDITNLDSLHMITSIEGGLSMTKTYLT